jgi:hypothetical protein
MTMVLKDRQSTALGALLAVGLLAGLLTLAVALNPPAGREETGLFLRAQDPDAPPIAGGTKATVLDAVRFLPVPFFRPDNTLASDDSLRDVWTVSDNAEVYARYTSGVVLKVRRADDGELSNEEWASALAGDGVMGNIEIIGGYDVFIVPQNHPSLGSARFFINGTLVTLIGGGDFSVDDLRQLTQSVIATIGKVQAEKASLS